MPNYHQSFSIKDILASPMAMTTGQANVVFQLIKRPLKQHQVINLDFYGIDILTTSFMNQIVDSISTVIPRKMVAYHLTTTNLNSMNQTKFIHCMLETPLSELQQTKLIFNDVPLP